MIASVGGFVYVTAADGTAKAALTDKDGASISNPLALTNGSFDFYVADTITTVDLYIQSPTGHFIVAKGVKSSGNSSIFVDNGSAHTTVVIPFNIADTTAAVETSCGFTCIGAVQPNVAVDVVTVDATETIDVGTDSTDSGDANGFLALADVDVAGYIKGSVLATDATLGAKLFVLDSANAGDDAPEQDTSQIGKEITYTLTAGSDTAAGFIILPMQLPVSSL